MTLYYLCVGQASPLFTTPDVCHWMEAVAVENGPPIVVSLSRRTNRSVVPASPFHPPSLNRFISLFFSHPLISLYANGHLITTGCGSFALHPWHGFVLFTTLGAQMGVSFASLATIGQLLSQASAASGYVCFSAQSLSIPPPRFSSSVIHALLQR